MLAPMKPVVAMAAILTEFFTRWFEWFRCQGVCPCANNIAKNRRVSHGFEGGKPPYLVWKTVRFSFGNNFSFRNGSFFCSRWHFQSEGFDDVGITSSSNATNYISVAELADGTLDGFGIAGLLSQGSLSLLLTVSRKLRLYLHLCCDFLRKS